MLMPKKTKFRKKQKGNMKGSETRGVSLEFGSYGQKQEAFLLNLVHTVSLQLSLLGLHHVR